MRKVILSNSVTLDGFFERPNKELNWQIVDGENKEHAIDLLKLLTCRGYEPINSKERSREIADKMNNLPKIVFSKTLQEIKWNNSRLVKENIGEEISKMKQQPGKDMVIFGSGSIVSTFMQHGLIDEYRIIVNSIVLGYGNPLFKGINGKQNLKLLKTRVFSSGVVILYYQPIDSPSSG